MTSSALCFIIGVAGVGEPAPVPGWEKLSDYGVLGIFVLISLVVNVHLFRQLTKERENFEKAAAQHKEEVAKLVDRHIESTTSQVRAYHELAGQITKVLESLERRIDRGARNR